MGIPAFFRWLHRKYPDMVEYLDTQNLDPETRLPVWFDNLYLDMNNIIHPCTHPEDKPPPQNEEEMFEAIFDYTDRIIALVRPRNLVFLAIDGVAPRAKMNQQRTRRFRAVQESEEKRKQIEDIREKLRAQNIEPDRSDSTSFDSNVITPGTEFMTNLSNAFQGWIKKKLSTFDERKVWHKDLKVILSDASVPGEGEHKIMNYLRGQKNGPNYDPNLRHCLYGADADLIMLGLATHEKHFTILREEFKPNQQRPCELCGTFGHKLNDCEGIKSLEDAKKMPVGSGNQTDYIMIKLHTLKRLLKQDMQQESYVNLNFERFVDDYIFLCFFVGNDFLPHLPSLDIRENAVDRLVRIYHNVNRSYWRPGLYLTDNGTVDLEKCQEILHELGYSEIDIFKRRRVNDERYESRQLQNKRVKWREEHPNGERFPEPEPVDDFVRLGDHGAKERYYSSKFGFKGHYRDIADMVTKEYIRGLCWVLAYYYKGCPDWQWFYPFHYAPFAEDMRSIMNIDLNFNSSAPPFKPLEQLMGVFPEKSASALPESWRKLMSDPESPIIDFYPTNFKIDMNGKKQAYLGVAILPFIDETRLFKALEPVYSNLNEEETIRNSYGEEMLFDHKTADMERSLLLPIPISFVEASLIVGDSAIEITEVDSDNPTTQQVNDHQQNEPSVILGTSTSGQSAAKMMDSLSSTSSSSSTPNPSPPSDQQQRNNNNNKYRSSSSSTMPGPLPPLAGGNSGNSVDQTNQANDVTGDKRTDLDIESRLVAGKVVDFELTPAGGHNKAKIKKKKKKKKKEESEMFKKWGKKKSEEKKAMDKHHKEGMKKKKEEGKKKKKKWGHEEHGLKKKGNFKKKKWGKKVKKGKGIKKGKKGKKFLKDKGHKHTGFKNVYHKEEYGGSKKWHDIKRVKEWDEESKKWKKKWNKEKGKKYKGQHMKKFEKKKKEGKKYEKMKKDKYKKYKKEKFEKGKKKKMEEHGKKKEGGIKKKEMEMKKKKKKKKP